MAISPIRLILVRWMVSKAEYKSVEQRWAAIFTAPGKENVSELQLLGRCQWAQRALNGHDLQIQG